VNRILLVILLGSIMGAVRNPVKAPDGGIKPSDVAAWVGKSMVDPEGQRVLDLSQLAEIAWREGDVLTFPAGACAAFGFGSKGLPDRVLTAKISEVESHEVYVVLLDDGTKKLILARRLSNDLWLINTSFSGQYVKGFRGLFHGHPTELAVAEGQTVLDQEVTYWMDWLVRRGSR
jgi:hypothetical protein